jgi:hypothetical protein
MGINRLQEADDLGTSTPSAYVGNDHIWKPSISCVILNGIASVTGSANKGQTIRKVMGGVGKKQK